MSKMLIITEKPKVAKALTDVPLFRDGKWIRGSQPYYGYYEGDQFIISWCRGHLLRQIMPEEWDEQYSWPWKPEHQIIIPKEFKKVPVEDTKEQYEFVRQILNRGDVSLVVNAADAGREGELIFREVFEGCNKPLKRLWTSEYTVDALIKAIKNMKNEEECRGLYYAGLARERMDFTTGILLSRWATTRYGMPEEGKKRLLNLGRVMGVNLCEIYRRENAIEEFKAVPFYVLQAFFGFDAYWLNQEGEIRNLHKGACLGVLKKVKGKPGKVVQVEKKESKNKPPSLFNLTDLSKYMIKSHGWNGAGTLKVLQQLYEAGFVSYPRTDSRHLPSSMHSETVKVMELVAKIPVFEEFRVEVPEKHKIFNDSLVSDHYGLVPTKRIPKLDDLDPKQRLLYETIVKRFMAVFHEPALFEKMEIIIECEREKFISKGKRLIHPGWLRVFQEDDQEEGKEDGEATGNLPDVKQGDVLNCEKGEVLEGKTTPPKPYTEDTLLTFMETCGRDLDDEVLKEVMKGARIATPATVTEVIPKLVAAGYVVTSGKRSTLKLTVIGRFIAEKLMSIVDIATPILTAQMELQLGQIERGEISFEEFMTNFLSRLKGWHEHLPQVNEAEILRELIDAESEVGKCKKCGHSMVKLTPKEKKPFYSCTGYPHCHYSIPGEAFKNKLSVSQVKQLLEGKEMSHKGVSEKGEYIVILSLDSEGKMVHRFPTIDDKKIIDCKESGCNGYIIIKSGKYGSYYGCTNCKIMIPGTFRNKSITPSMAKQLFEKGSTGEVTFSKKDKSSKYKGKIILKNNTLEFEFSK